MRTMTLDTNKPIGNGKHLLRIISTGLRLLHELEAWQKRKATERVLQGLSDRTLRDIGLDRSEIPSVARKAGDNRRQR